MLPETVQLEKLRQKIEESEFEIGDRSDYLNYGKPNPKQASQANEQIQAAKANSSAAKVALKQQLETLRAQKPQAIEEWINYHVGLLQNIISEQTTDANARTRKFVAQETIDNWEKVRNGELEYVNINWHFLKDYKAIVRSFNEKSAISSPGQMVAEGKAWWQFWK